VVHQKYRTADCQSYDTPAFYGKPEAALRASPGLSVRELGPPIDPRG
jgi:hypothetical protein